VVAVVVVVVAVVVTVEVVVEVVAVVVVVVMVGEVVVVVVVSSGSIRGSSSDGGGDSDGGGSSGGSSGSSSGSKVMWFQWANLASTFHIDPSIHSSSVASAPGIHLTGEGGCAGENGYGGADAHISRLLCEEAAFISQLSSQEVNLTHVEDRK
jgi:hypothetical protein